MANRLNARDISYRQIIRHLSLSLAPGELTVLIGPNGAGKSTLLRLLSGWLTPDSGRCELNARSLARWPAAELARLRAVMRQRAPAPPGWTVESMIAAGRSPWDGLAPLPMVRQIMALTDCTPLAGRDISTLSGGEQQRVQLARALAQLWRHDGPQGWLFLDEPTSALDLRHQQLLLRLLKRLTRSHPLHVCAVLHDPNQAALWADRLLVLHQGELVADGPARKVLTPGNLARWFGADVEVVSPLADGAPWVRLKP